MKTDTITFYYTPSTRATGTLILLEELGIKYDLHVLNMKMGEQRKPDYLAINPLGKVPAIRHGDTLVTEQAAIYLYLADLFAEKGLAPALDDPQRGAYLRWMVFYGNCFEPAVVDHYLKRPPASQNETPYSSYEEVMDTLENALRPGPYLLGERMTAADLLWATALNWTTMFGIVPDRPVFRAYIDRITSREIYRRVAAEDQALTAEHEEIAKKAGLAA